MLAWSRSANRRIDWKSSAKIATPVGAVVGVGRLGRARLGVVVADRRADRPGQPVHGRAGEDVVAVDRVLEELRDPRQPAGRRVLQRVRERLRLRGLVGVVGKAAAGGELLEELHRRRVVLAEIGELGGVAGGEREQLRDVHAGDVLGVVAADLGRDHRAAVVAVRAVALVAQPRHELGPRARDARHVPAGLGRRAREPGPRHRRDDEVERVGRVAAVGARDRSAAR